MDTHTQSFIILDYSGFRFQRLVTEHEHEHTGRSLLGHSWGSLLGVEIQLHIYRFEKKTK